MLSIPALGTGMGPGDFINICNFDFFAHDLQRLVKLHRLYHYVEYIRLLLRWKSGRCQTLTQNQPILQFIATEDKL